jgi:UDP-N-acetyl-2-amino-2-deoxyglucuronate dehydrogenase
VEPLHTRRLRTAIVGGGLISDTHARAVQQLPGAELVAFVGGAGSKARAGQFGVAHRDTLCWRDESCYAASWHGCEGLGGGGALINQGIHTVDMLCELMGPARRVSAVGRRVADTAEVEDVALALVEFDNGAIGTIEATTAFYSAVSGPTVADAVERLEISGTLGSAILSAGRLLHRSIATCDVPFADISRAPASALPLEPFRLQHQDFVDAVRTGQEPVVTGRDWLRTLALVSAVYESARLQKPVDIVEGR